MACWKRGISSGLMEGMSRFLDSGLFTINPYSYITTAIMAFRSFTGKGRKARSGRSYGGRSYLSGLPVAHPLYLFDLYISRQFDLLFDLALYARYQQEPETFRRQYDEFLSSTGVADAKTLAARFGM